MAACACSALALSFALAGPARARDLRTVAPQPAMNATSQQGVGTTGNAQRADAAAQSATVLVYLNGSDLESMAGMATADITEMLSSGIGTNANVVIETLGTRTWHGFDIASDHTQRYVVKQGELQLVDDSLGQLDTTDPKTLADFIRWGTENYPADRYILVLWDHGAGPVYGFGYDEFQGEGAALTLDEMKEALAANPDVHFDLIGMDCCIMSSLETCYALSPYCDYFVLSEDFEPGIGWSYGGWMSQLEENPGISTPNLGKAIIDGMVADTASYADAGEATLALIDAAKIPDLYAAWLDFAYANTDALQGTNYSHETEWQGLPVVERAGDNKAHGDVPSWYDDMLAYLFGYELSLGEQGQGYDYGYGSDSSDGYGSGYGTPDEYGYEYGYGDGTEFEYDPFSGGEDWYGWGGSSYDDFSWDMWDTDGSYVTMTDYYVTDLGEVATSVDGAEAEALQLALDEAVVEYGCTSAEAGMAGLAVTLPYGDAEFYDQLEDVFTACGIDNDYVDWLEGFVDVTAEGTETDGDELDAQEEPDGWDTYEEYAPQDDYNDYVSDPDAQDYDDWLSEQIFAA